MVRRKKRTLKEQAYETVLHVRGSNDVPAFDLCVEMELKRLKAARLDRIKVRRFGEP